MKAAVNSPQYTRNNESDIWVETINKTILNLPEKLKMRLTNLVLFIGSVFTTNVVTTSAVSNTNQMEINMPDFDNEALANYYAEGLKIFSNASIQSNKKDENKL